MRVERRARADAVRGACLKESGATLASERGTGGRLGCRPRPPLPPAASLEQHAGPRPQAQLCKPAEGECLARLARPAPGHQRSR